MGERLDRARNAERPEWLAKGRSWNSGWISVFFLIVFWLPTLLVVLMSDKPAFALLYPGVFILLSAITIYQSWKRRRSGGRF